MTLIPNYLLTGMAAIAVSLMLMWWSVRRIDSRHGATVFILLCVLLLMVGGGIGFMLLALPTWAFTTRINKPLTWWKRVLPERFRPLLARSWPITLTAAVFFLLGLFIAITGYMPNVSDPEIIFNIDWSILLVGLILFLISLLVVSRKTLSHEPEGVKNGVPKTF